MAACSRRRFLLWSGVSGLALLDGCSFFPQKASAKARVVIVGGGFAGATVAKYLRKLDSTIEIILIEPKPAYISCPGSNWIFAGLTNLQSLTLSYDGLSTHYGIRIVSDTASALDIEKRRVVLANGQTIDYDKLVLSPGIDFLWDTLPGYDQNATHAYPHAWQAGQQTIRLVQQMQAMPNGGTLVMTVPAEPYRCPPGPYERASMMAYWLKKNKPRSKIIILDAKTKFSKQSLFETGWSQYYGYGSSNSLIEWRSLTNDPLVSLDTKAAILRTSFGDKITAQVLNIIPPQQAARIARDAGLTAADGWCPVEVRSSRSTLDANTYIIGDAANYAPIPKSAFAANSEAKFCATAIICELNEQPVPEAHWLNTCYSLVTPNYGISVAGIYKLKTERHIAAVKNSGGFSPADGRNAWLEAKYASSVLRSLLFDSFSTGFPDA